MRLQKIATAHQLDVSELEEYVKKSGIRYRDTAMGLQVADDKVDEIINGFMQGETYTLSPQDKSEAMEQPEQKTSTQPGFSQWRDELATYKDEYPEILLSTIDSIPGLKIVGYSGSVSSVGLIAQNFGPQETGMIAAILTATFKPNTVATAKSRALNALKKQAKQRGANAIIGLSLTFSSTGQAIIYDANGTAVVVDNMTDTLSIW